MKRVIDQPQKSDMGSGWGHFEVPVGTTLRDALNWIHKNMKSWGTITIYKGDGDIMRCFDYDLYNRKEFYHNLSGWQYGYTVREIKFDYCFMSENIDIYTN